MYNLSLMIVSLCQQIKGGGNSVNTAKHKMNTINNAFRALVNGNTGTVYNGVAGTNNDIRSIVWEAFRTAYSNTVTVSINGVSLVLQANHSVSGKSTSYHCSLTAEQYVQITGSDFGLSKKKTPYLNICFGICEIHGGGNYYTKIANNNIYII